MAVFVNGVEGSNFGVIIPLALDVGLMAVEVIPEKTIATDIKIGNLKAINIFT